MSCCPLTWTWCVCLLETDLTTSMIFVFTWFHKLYHPRFSYLYFVSGMFVNDSFIRQAVFSLDWFWNVSCFLFSIFLPFQNTYIVSSREQVLETSSQDRAMGSRFCDGKARNRGTSNTRHWEWPGASKGAASWGRRRTKHRSKKQRGDCQEMVSQDECT